jgi:hypothetical protein
MHSGHIQSLPVFSSFRRSWSSTSWRQFFGCEHSLRGSFYSILFLHGGTPYCRRQPTSSRFQDILVSSLTYSDGANRPDCTPYADSTFLQPASLLPLMGCIIPGSGSVSVALLQAAVSSNSDRAGCITAHISHWMVPPSQTRKRRLWISFLPDQI